MTKYNTRLQTGIVDIWSVNIKQAMPDLSVCLAQLDQTELDRAGQITSRDKYHEFVITRGILKTLLAQQLHTVPADIHLTTSQHGKPVLTARHNITFSVSHSHDESLIALTTDTPIGIDIEKIRPTPNWSHLSKRFFSAAECEALQHYAAPDTLPAFFACWTRKEAFVKATGDGIAYGLQQFEVNVDPDSKVGLLKNCRDAAVTEWSLHNVPTREGYTAALAGHRADIKIRMNEL